MQKTIEKKYIIKFIALSIIGIFLFLIPIGGAVPVVNLVNKLKSLLGEGLPLLVVFNISVLFILTVVSMATKNPKLEEHIGKDPLFKKIFYFLSFIVVWCITLGFGPEEIFANPKIGGSVMNLAGSVMLTVTLAGWLIIFVLKSGIVEFAGILLEPLMRPLFKMPGQAAVNCLSSYMVSPAVGVYMTSQYYNSNVYTRREAITAACCFSTVSVGYIGVLCSLGGIEQYYSKMVIASLVLIFILTAITVRIPPISKYSNTYANPEAAASQNSDEKSQSRLELALYSATNRSKEFTFKAFTNSLWTAIKFAQIIIGYMIPIVVVTLTLVHYTSVFQILGAPLAPIFSLLGLPNAAEIAPSALLGLIEVSLPAISVSGLSVATESAFFVVLLSILQVVFITEAGNAIMSSPMGIKFKDILFIFIVRTIIAIPLCAAAVHLMF